MGNCGGTTEGNGVVDATSLQYDAEVTYQGATSLYKFVAKDIGTDNMALRIDVLGGEAGNYTYTLNVADQTAWVGVSDKWSVVSSDFTN